MAKDIEKTGKTKTFVITLGTIAALVGLIRVILKVANGDENIWEN